MYNTIRHAESKIEQGELPDEGSLPLWLTTDGIRTESTMLTYDELAENLFVFHESSMNLINALASGTSSTP